MSKTTKSMIYQAADPADPIRQGDIFRNVPHLELSLARLAIVGEDEPEVTTWQSIIESGDPEPVTALVAVEPVHAIVITQDCDAARGRHLCLAQIDKFLDVTGKRTTPPATAKKWMSLLTEHSRTNLRYFYLPADEALGFAERMAADFRSIIRLPREELVQLRRYRMGRLNDMATEHFRETLGQFYRRYPYNEWYPLNKEEAAAYAEAKKPEDIELYDWQK
jgi:hypothetical protein